jgi:hypothetical protein
MSSMNEEFRRQVGQLHQEGKEPRLVVFSHEGWMKVLREADSALVAVSTIHRDTYSGLKRLIDPRFEAPDIVVTDKTAAEYGFKEERPSAVTFRVDGLDPSKSTMEVVGKSLTAAQLCDIIRSWLEGDDSTHWGAFEKELDRIVTQHGRFE